MTLRISPAWYRTLALAVAFALVLTSVPAPALVWASASAPIPSQNSTRHTVASSQLNDLVYEISPSIGQVLEAWQPSDRAPTGVVIHIQDVHADPQVQRHMSDLLGYLHQRLGVQRVAIEGAAGECATDLYASLPHPPTTERLARLFRDEGLFTGAEYYAITHPHDISLWGVEDEAVYLDHLEAYQETLESSATAGILLDRLRDDLARLRSLIFPRALQSLLALREAYLKNGVRAFQPYVRELLRLARASSLYLTPYPHLQILDRADQLHRRIDMRQVRKDSDRLAATLKPRLTTAQQQEWRQATKAFAAQQVSPERYYEFVAERAAATGVQPFSAAPSTSEPSHHGTWSEFLLEAAIPRGAYPALRQYLTYLHLLRRFISLEVAKEVDALLEAVCEAHAATESQRSVDRLLKRVEILDGLVHLKLSPEQYRRYQEEREAMSATVLEASLRRLEVKPALTLDPRLKSLLERRAPWEAFYALAVKRDEALARNTLAQLEAHEDQPLVLITGGFHSPGILQYLKTHAIAYFVVAPKTTEPIDETRYRARLHGHVPSVTELLQKLNQETLSPTSATWLTAQQLRRTKGQPPEPNASQRRQKKSKPAREDKLFASFFFTDVILLSRDVPDWQLQLQQWKAHHAADADAFGIDLKVDRTTGRVTVIALGQNVQLDATTGRLVSAALTQTVTESASTEERGSVERQPQPKMPIIGRKFSSVAHAVGVSSRSTLLKTIAKFPAALLLGSLLLLGQPSPAASQEVIVQPPNVDVVLSSVRVYRLHTNIAPSDSTFLSKLRYVKTHDGRELLTDADFTFSETDRASVLKLLAEKIPQLPENLRGVAEQALEKLRQFHPPTLPTRRPSAPAPQRQNGETGTVMPPPVFGSLQEIADRLPGLILQELAAHGISSEAQIAAQDLLELTRELYTRMGLLDRHYHHHVHNLAVTYAALVLGARTGRIQSARDAKLLFLGALWHDFHLRDAIGQRDGQILGTLASVEETLRQLHDALGLPMVTGPPQEKRYAELIGPVRDMLRHASELWFAPDTLPDYAAELDALIRRTDFPSDVGPAPAAFAEQATRIRTAISNWVVGTIAADAVDDVIRTTQTALGEVQPTLTPAQITAAERVIRIEAAYFHALQQVSEDRRLSIHQLAELLERGADQTGLLWLTNPEMFERDILAGLQQELPFVPAEGNYEGFLKPRVLTPETLHLLRDLPEPSRHNFLAMIRHFAERGGPSAFEDWRARETQVRAMLGIEPPERGAVTLEPLGGRGPGGPGSPDGPTMEERSRRVVQELTKRGEQALRLELRRTLGSLSLKAIHQLQAVMANRLEVIPEGHPATPDEREAMKQLAVYALFLEAPVAASRVKRAKPEEPRRIVVWLSYDAGGTLQRIALRTQRRVGRSPLGVDLLGGPMPRSQERKVAALIEHIQQSWGRVDALANIPNIEAQSSAVPVAGVQVERAFMPANVEELLRKHPLLLDLGEQIMAETDSRLLTQRLMAGLFTLEETPERYPLTALVRASTIENEVLAGGWPDRNEEVLAHEWIHLRVTAMQHVLQHAADMKPEAVRQWAPALVGYTRFTDRVLSDRWQRFRTDVVTLRRYAGLDGDNWRMTEEAAAHAIGALASYATAFSPYGVTAGPSHRLTYGDIWALVEARLLPTWMMPPELAQRDTETVVEAATYFEAVAKQLEVSGRPAEAAQVRAGFAKAAAGGNVSYGPDQPPHAQ